MYLILLLQWFVIIPLFFINEFFNYTHLANYKQNNMTETMQKEKIIYLDK